MGELADGLVRLEEATARLQDIKSARTNIGSIKDAYDALALTAERTIRERLPVAQSFDVEFGADFPAIEAAATGLRKLRQALLDRNVLDLKSAEIRPVTDLLSDLGNKLNEKSLGAWLQFRDNQLGDGIEPLLTAAGRAGVKVPVALAGQIAAARRRPGPPDREALAAIRQQVAEFETIRANLTGGDEEIENLLMRVTARNGVGFADLKGSEKWMEWLSTRGLVASLRVVLGESKE